MPVKHLFTSAKSDGADATVVQPSDWNDDHVLTGLLQLDDVVAPGSQAQFTIMGDAARTHGLFILNDGDTGNRLSLSSAVGVPTIRFGSGTGSPDVLIKRPTGSPYIDIVSNGEGALRIYSDSASAVGVYGSRTGDAAYRFYLQDVVGGSGKPGLVLGSGSTAEDVKLYRDAADLLKTDDVFYAAGNALASDDQPTTPLTLTSADTWYMVGNLGATFVAKYTGQRFLILMNAVMYPSQICYLYGAARIDSDAGGTFQEWVSIPYHYVSVAGVTGTRPYTVAKVYTAVAGDVGNTRYVRMYVQQSGYGGGSMTATFYAAAGYGTSLQVMALP